MPANSTWERQSFSIVWSIRKGSYGGREVWILNGRIFNRHSQAEKHRPFCSKLSNFLQTYDRDSLISWKDYRSGL